MSEKGKISSRRNALLILGMVVGCAMLAACESQVTIDPTATSLPPTVTRTIEPTATNTPEPTITPTPEPSLPLSVTEFTQNLPGEFSWTWSGTDQTWKLNQHLTLQLTETETQVTDQTVAQFNPDGTQMTINVKGEQVQIPVADFGLSSDRSGEQGPSYQLVPGADVKTGIGFTLGVKDNTDGRMAYGFNVWGKWVENKDYQVGNLQVNDFNLFAGALQINPEKADEIYTGLVGGIYNIQVVTGNQAILDQYPTQQAFLAAAQSGVEFTGLNIPQYYPQATERNLYNRMATVQQVERMQLNTVQTGFQEQSRDRILHPINPYRSFFSYFQDPGLGSFADVRIGTPNTGGVSVLDLTFGRLKQINPFGCFGTMQVETPQEQLVGSANQLLEMWIYTINSSNNPFSPYVAGLDYPLLNFFPSLYSLYQINPDYACPWSESDLIMQSK